MSDPHVASRLKRRVRAVVIQAYQVRKLLKLVIYNWAVGKIFFAELSGCEVTIL